MDADLEGMSRDQLVVEVKRLRHGMRQHGDSTGHELCLVPSGALVAATRAIRLPSRHPDWPEFLRGCKYPAEDNFILLPTKWRSPAGSNVVTVDHGDQNPFDLSFSVRNCAVDSDTLNAEPIEPDDGHELTSAVVNLHVILRPDR